MTVCSGLNSIRVVKDGSAFCYTPESGKFLDWVKMEKDGLI